MSVRPRRATLMAFALVALSCAGAKAKDVEPGLHIVGEPAPGDIVVALTFDACMGATDGRILSTLVDNAVPATIFVTHAG